VSVVIEKIKPNSDDLQQESIQEEFNNEIVEIKEQINNEACACRIIWWEYLSKNLIMKLLK